METIAMFSLLFIVPIVAWAVMVVVATPLVIFELISAKRSDWKSFVLRFYTRTIFGRD